MHECLLCKRNMKKSKNLFGSGCINNILKLLELEKPARGKNKEQILYNSIMKRNNISRLSKEQKILLTDRYLTYQYLDKLHYVELEKIKEQIQKDIENIGKKSNEILTDTKIKLKDAYDLFKKGIKFEENLDKLKKYEKQEDEEKLKALIASFSYIFNLYKNKNQYEKDVFKGMQFAFWQTVIEIGGKYANYEIAADFLQHSLEEDPKDLIITKGRIIEEIKKDTNFQDKINTFIEKYGKRKTKFTITEDIKESITFNKSDLYFAIHDTKISLIKAEKNKENKWDLEIKLHDRYDYTNFKWLDNYYNDAENVAKSMLSSELYNYAYFSMKFGVMKEYNIDINFKLEDYEVIV